jgi:hypothetical protein
MTTKSFPYASYALPGKKSFEPIPRPERENLIKDKMHTYEKLFSQVLGVPINILNIGDSFDPKFIIYGCYGSKADCYDVEICNKGFFLSDKKIVSRDLPNLNCILCNKTDIRKGWSLIRSATELDTDFSPSLIRAKSEPDTDLVQPYLRLTSGRGVAPQGHYIEDNAYKNVICGSCKFIITKGKFYVCEKELNIPSERSLQNSNRIGFDKPTSKLISEKIYCEFYVYNNSAIICDGDKIILFKGRKSKPLERKNVVKNMMMISDYLSYDVRFIISNIIHSIFCKNL